MIRRSIYIPVSAITKHARSILDGRVRKIVDESHIVRICNENGVVYFNESFGNDNLLASFVHNFAMQTCVQN